LDMYEQPLSYAAIDAGADLILGAHAHIMKGIEVYREKFIFHGMGNFITVTKALTEASNFNLARWIERRKKLFGFEPDPDYPTYPFHPEAKQAIIAKFIIEDKKVARVSCIPCWVNKKGQPEVLMNDERARQVIGYMEKITREAGLNARFEWDGDQAVVF
ncbi:MAG: capA 1, partial [Deltaproteobacteria bacterium]|nr:capA 1 [Deltaproteobacteria bacterium]